MPRMANCRKLVISLPVRARIGAGLVLAVAALEAELRVALLLDDVLGLVLLAPPVADAASGVDGTRLRHVERRAGPAGVLDRVLVDGAPAIGLGGVTGDERQEIALPVLVLIRPEHLRAHERVGPLDEDGAVAQPAVVDALLDCADQRV